MPSDAEINALIERLSQFEGRDWETTACYNGLRLEAAAFLAALRDDRDQYKTAFADGYDAAKDEYRARVRELEQKLERARVALAETTEWLDDASHPYIPGTASAEGWNAEREARLNRARAALAEIGQRG